MSTESVGRTEREPMADSIEDSPMDADVLTALRASIKKWEGIVAGTEVDRGVFNCALCEMFTLANDTCDGCPVNDATDNNGCIRSPYDQWDRVNPWPIAHPDYRRATTYKHRAAAQAEVDFLKSLLPPGVSP